MSRRLLHLLLSIAVLAALPLPAAAQPPGEDVQVEVLSNRADLISGGNALVEVVLPDGVSAEGMTVDVDGRDVTDQVQLRENGRVMGVVDGLEEGENLLTATLADGSGAFITITNHSRSGPIFSGPQITPWLCSTEDEGLGEATDEFCNAPTTFAFTYVNTDGESGAYDPEDPADDVALTTTDQGQEVPHIIRTEKGTMNRGIYEFSVLFNPAEPWEPWAPQAGFNGKLLWVMGASSGTHHVQSGPESTDDGLALPLGFGVGSTSLNVNGNNSNQVVSAETMMMVQEHIRETYGETRYTIGKGCSGGSIQQARIANSYPGLLDGIQPNCSYPDTWTVRQEVYDCLLINDLLTTPEGAFLASPGALGAVTGYETGTSCAAWEALFGANGDPRTGCQLPEEQQYDPETNPDGTRCTSNDYEINLWGQRPEELWGPVEQQIGRGFALNLTANAGIQYGLQALQEGNITPAQFVAINESIGALDLDYNKVVDRTAADPGAVAIASRAGLVNDYSQIDKVAVIDLRGSSNNEIHTDFHSHEARLRMDNANGHHDNQVIWTFPTSIVVPPAIGELAFFTMDAWLTAVEADPSDAPLEEKIVANKPGDVVDQCWFDAGESPPSQGESCDQRYPFYGAPRTAAGMPLSHDITSCVQTPLPDEAPSEGYGPLPFVGDQWARLAATFPDGVCDWTQRHPDEVTSIPWLTFAGGPGGEPLGDPPTSTPFGPEGLTEVIRHGGDSRFTTAVEISKATHDTADVVVLAAGGGYADALAGAPLAAQLGAPLLLTNPESIPSATVAEIQRLGASTAVLLGGPAAIGQGVVDQLTSLEMTVDRIEGEDRFGTAQAIARRMDDPQTVYVVNGTDGGAGVSPGWPDAVSVAALAAHTGGAILLVRPGSTPAGLVDLITELAPAEVVIVGGTAAVGDAVESQMEGIQGTEVTRVGGQTRYGTSAAVLERMIEAGMSEQRIWVSTGTNFPDALSAGAAAGAAGESLVIVDGLRLESSPETVDALRALAPAQILITGGTAAVSTATADQLRTLGTDQ